MMNGGTGKSLFRGLLLLLLVGCQHRPADLRQQDKDGYVTDDLELVNVQSTKGKLVNSQDYVNQIRAIKQASSSLFEYKRPVYQAIQNWLKAGSDPQTLARFGINTYQMEGKDGSGNVQFTGYYTPLLHARHTRQGEFQYPLYRMPAKGKRGRLPHRAAIHRGALSDKYILAYSNSLMDNFMMEVQGSGYVDFGDGQPPVLYSYAGKNGHRYQSIGKVLIDRGEVSKEQMSMQAILQWAERHSEAEVRELLEQNPSYVFFLPQAGVPVKGACGVPLIAKASVAADKRLIPAGSTLLTEVPVLDGNGKFTGQYEMRLMIALDVGGAIKGHHLDIYHGIGEKAGKQAGFYNHSGRVWLLETADRRGRKFNAYRSPYLVQ